MASEVEAESGWGGNTARGAGAGGWPPEVSVGAQASGWAEAGEGVVGLAGGAMVVGGLAPPGFDDPTVMASFCPNRQWLPKVQMK